MKRPPAEKREKTNDSKARNGRKTRLGGKGLSLEAFTNAKTKRLDYNPAYVKTQKEFYRNAKHIRKFKRTLKQQKQTENYRSTSTVFQQENDDGVSDRKIKRGKKNSLQSLRMEYEKKQEEMVKARMEREEMIRAKNEEREIAEARRKELKHKMLKKTRSGQPIMKYRIEHILESIQDLPTN
ncbi:rRNA-processing protein FYV7 [Aristolochia californica]|uniref:rRNA-processing protein FYV7 n=1 Tax=Aristolochia californica TaxID=171875 RepID=UPI0035D9560E